MGIWSQKAVIYEINHTKSSLLLSLRITTTMDLKFSTLIASFYISIK